MRTLDLAGWGGLLTGVAALVTALRSCQNTDAVSLGSETISNSAADDHAKLEALTQSVHDLADNVNSAFDKEHEAIRDNGKAIEDLRNELIRIVRATAPSTPTPTARPVSSAAIAPRINVTVPPAVSRTPFPRWNAAQRTIESK